MVEHSNKIKPMRGFILVTMPDRAAKSNKENQSQWIPKNESQKYLALFESVLAGAVLDLKRTHTYSNAMYAALGRKTRRWFLEDKGDHLFSFIHVCRVLGYSPDVILEKLDPYLKPIIPPKKLSPEREKKLRRAILSRLRRYRYLTLTDMIRAPAKENGKRISGTQFWEIREIIERLVRCGLVRQDLHPMKKFVRYSLTEKGKNLKQSPCQESDI